MNITFEVCQVVADILEKDIIEINEKSDSSSIDNWDSLAHIQIIIEIEVKFNIKFKAIEINDLKSISRIILRVKELIP